MKLNNLFYLFLNQLEFCYADHEGLTFRCSSADFLLIPDNVEVTIEVYYEFGTVRFQAHKEFEQLSYHEILSEMTLPIPETTMIAFRDWVNTIPEPTNPKTP